MEERRILIVKLNTFQAISLTVTVMISHIILNIPNHLIASTGSATILNVIYVSILSLLILSFMFRVFKLFPKHDIIDICEYAVR